MSFDAAAYAKEHYQQNKPEYIGRAKARHAREYGPRTRIYCSRCNGFYAASRDYLESYTNCAFCGKKFSKKALHDAARSV